MEINILGTDYHVIVKDSNNPNHSNITNDTQGICDPFNKVLVLNFDACEDRITKEIWNEYYSQILRHEIVHAFLCESGLNMYSEDETIVDWIAAMVPKIAAIDERSYIDELAKSL